MAAGDIPYILGFVYDSDDDVPIGAGDPIYYMGLPFAKPEYEHAYKTAKGTIYWSGDDANPAGYVPEKIVLHETQITVPVVPIDVVPFYIALGGTPTYASSIYTVRGSTSGSVPDLIFHRENNNLYAEQAKEYSVARCTQMEIMLMEGFLSSKLKFLAETEYNMTSNSVVRQTGVPYIRGSVDSGNYKTPSTMIDYGKLPYPVLGNSMGHSVAWNSLSLPFHQDVKFSVKNNQVVKEYSASNWGTFHNNAKREYSDLVMTFLTKDGNDDDLSDMEAYVDNSTKDNLVWSISRRHANDKLQMTFEDAYLESWNVRPIPGGSGADALIIGTWTGITNWEVVDQSVLANGSADPIANADVEAVT